MTLSPRKTAIWWASFRCRVWCELHTPRHCEPGRLDRTQYMKNKRSMVSLLLEDFRIPSTTVCPCARVQWTLTSSIRHDSKRINEMQIGSRNISAPRNKKSKNSQCRINGNRGDCASTIQYNISSWLNRPARLLPPLEHYITAFWYDTSTNNRINKHGKHFYLRLLQRAPMMDTIANSAKVSTTILCNAALFCCSSGQADQHTQSELAVDIKTPLMTPTESLQQSFAKKEQILYGEPAAIEKYLERTVTTRQQSPPQNLDFANGPATQLCTKHRSRRH